MKYLELDYRVIEGWDNYVVTSCGRVFRKDGKEVSQVLTGETQYKYVNLRKDGSRKLIRVHRLVALAFLPAVEGKAFVDHIDRDKMNNVASNLRWTTASENQVNRDCTRILSCGRVGYHHLTKTQLSFAFKNKITHLSVEDIKLLHNTCVAIGGSFERLTSTLELNGETRTVGAWCVYLGIKYGTLMRNLRKKSNSKWVWTEDDKHNGVVVYRRKTEKELDKESDQRTAARKLGMTLEDYLNRDTRKVITVKGQEIVYSNVAELCKLYGVSEARVGTRMRRKGMTLEEALQAPVERVGKYLYNGTVYTIKELCSVIGIEHRKFINYKADYGGKFLDKLGIRHLGIQPYVL